MVAVLAYRRTELLRALLPSWQARSRVSPAPRPVRSRLPEPVDPWVLGSGRFDRVRRPTGARLHGGATNYLLLDLARVRALGLRFDERLGLTGGEDTLFTHSARGAGPRSSSPVPPVPACG